MSGRIYNPAFNSTRHEETRYAAERILSLVLAKYPGISSAIDVGCAVGTFLAALRAMGVTDLRGLDGEWVRQSQLVIDPSEFTVMDLKSLKVLDRHFDLAICLEVAEHLPESSAASLVGFLCECSDIVLFSAAIPGQGGVGHLNEAWLSYWAVLFEQNGFVPEDVVRPAIWSDRRIPFWYRQNCIVFRKGEASDHLAMPLDIVHPELFEGCRPPTSFLRTLKAKIRALFRQ